MNISTFLEMAADSFGDRIALISGATEVTYRQLAHHAQAAAAVATKNGAKHLALLATSSPATAIGLFGSTNAGIPFVPLNYRLTKVEIGQLLERIVPALLVADPALVEGVSIPAGITVMPVSEFISACGQDETAIMASHAEDDGIAVQIFTSGTTGQPKAAVLRHQNLAAYILETVEFGGAPKGDATIVTVPPYHIAGVAAILSSIFAGRQMVLMPNFDAAEWLRLIEVHRISNAFLVPTMLTRVVDHVEKSGWVAKDLHLRALAYGGGRMPLSTIEKAMNIFPGVDFTNAYGLTETSSTICLLGPDDHRQAAAAREPLIRRRLTSVGCPLPSIELQIRDDSGAPLPPETPGNIYVRGSQVSGEYKGIGSLLDEDGWFFTRDRGFVDSEGYLFLEGRTDDVIVRGAENISPGEIEDVLLEYPGVADVAVAAIPDEEWGESVGAAIVAREGQVLDVAELQAWVRDRLRSSRVPQYIIFVDALPYNETGKMLRRVVKEDLGRAITAHR